MLNSKWALLGLSILLSTTSFAQVFKGGEIHGNADVTTQYYNIDTLIGAPIVEEKALMNGFANLIYTNGPISAGLRYESYLNVLQGFDPGYRGNGIPYRFFRFNKEGLDITVGNFYEQFGNGQILRTYEERALGIDNAFDGVRVMYEPTKGVYLKGLIGKQRIFFDLGPGIVRGLDSEFHLNDLLPGLDSSKTKISIGGSFVSKYQNDLNPDYTLPQNVAAYGGRFNISREKIRLIGEYTYKMNDPSSDNGFIYKNGQAALITASYSQKGLGINVSGKFMDNMSFRSDRNQVINNLMINYLPALTKQHTYNLAATLYPYATQPNGEVGFQIDGIYKIPKKTALGGKYGTTIQVNYSWVNEIKREDLDDLGSTRLGYKAYLGAGSTPYFRDFNVELTRKLNKKVKLKASYFNILYNMEVVQGLGGKPIVKADIGVVDVLVKLKNKHAVRFEAQHMNTKQDQGNWAYGLVEYTVAPHWSFSVVDQYNYGNSNPDLRIHYLYGNVVYVKNANRFTVGYGRQRAGIFCVGGVCRNVPASNGLYVNITSSF